MKIKIKGVSWKIKFVDIIANEDNVLGQTQYGNKVILIKKGLGSEVVETMVYEIYHATLYECGLKHQAWDEELVSWFSHHFKEVGVNLVSLLKVCDKGLMKEFGKLVKNN